MLGQRAVIISILVVYTIFGAVYFGITALGCGNPANFLINTVQGKCISITGVVIPMSYAQTSFNAVVVSGHEHITRACFIVSIR